MYVSEIKIKKILSTGSEKKKLEKLIIIFFFFTFLINIYRHNQKKIVFISQSW